MSFHSLSSTTAALLLLSSHASASVFYVDLNCTNPIPPYTNRATAATNLGDTMRECHLFDTAVLTNRVYDYRDGEFSTNWTAMIYPANLTRPELICPCVPAVPA